MNLPRGPFGNSDTAGVLGSQGRSLGSSHALNSLPLGSVYPPQVRTSPALSIKRPLIADLPGALGFLLWVRGEWGPGYACPLSLSLLPPSFIGASEKLGLLPSSAVLAARRMGGATI